MTLGWLYCTTPNSPLLHLGWVINYFPSLWSRFELLMVVTTRLARMCAQYGVLCGRQQRKEERDVSIIGLSVASYLRYPLQYCTEVLQFSLLPGSCLRQVVRLPRRRRGLRQATLSWVHHAQTASSSIILVLYQLLHLTERTTIGQDCCGGAKLRSTSLSAARSGCCNLAYCKILYVRYYSYNISWLPRTALHRFVLALQPAVLRRVELSGRVCDVWTGAHYGVGRV